jgi:hypothetical protein
MLAWVVQLTRLQTSLGTPGSKRTGWHGFVDTVPATSEGQGYALPLVTKEEEGCTPWGLVDHSTKTSVPRTRTIQKEFQVFSLQCVLRRRAQSFVHQSLVKQTPAL